jgi:hypothetical protein
LHVFLDNFKGVAARRNPLPDPERDIEVNPSTKALGLIYMSAVSRQSRGDSRTPER